MLQLLVPRARQENARGDVVGVRAKTVVLIEKANELEFERRKRLRWIAHLIFGVEAAAKPCSLHSCTGARLKAPNADVGRQDAARSPVLGARNKYFRR